MKTYERYAGIDWGSETHQLCVMDSQRNVLVERAFPHTGQGLHELTEAMLMGGVESARVAVAIEVPRGPVVETLLERGVVVHVINPKQLDRFRDRHCVSGAKDDRRDAFVLADSLRTDPTAFRVAKVSESSVIQLRALSRLQEELVRERVALGNRLGDQLRRYFPQILSLDSVHDAPWVWALLELAPSPHAAKKLSKAKIATLLRTHRIRRLDADDVCAALATKPLTVAVGVVEASTIHVVSLIARLRLIRDEVKRCERMIRHVLQRLAGPVETAETKREHRDARVLLSLPGIGPIVGATILTEAEQALAARDYPTLRALSGVAPVTRASGKRSGANASVAMRRACNGRLRNATYYWIMNAVNRDPRVKARYAAQRARGHTHGRALRAVADRMLGVLIAMLRSGSLYEPRHATT